MRTDETPYSSHRREVPWLPAFVLWMLPEYRALC